MKYVFLIVLLAMTSLPARSEISQSEHESHHPKGDAAKAGSPMAAPAAGGGMMGGMGEMMKEMGGPKTKELYPSLMDMPRLAPNEAAALEERAHEEMKEGASLMSSGMATLTELAAGDDFRRMQETLGSIRQGLSRFESGLSVHRAVREGKPPPEAALRWFKSELRIDGTAAGEPARQAFGTSLFHFFIMTVLVLFAVTMIVFYFRKMKNAATLLRQLGSPVTAGAGAAPGPAAVFPASAPSPPAAAPAPQVAKAEPSPPPGAGSAVAVPEKKALSLRWKGKLKVAKIIKETPTVRTFRLVSPDGADLPFTYEPGQFLIVSVPGDGLDIKRSYTIASHPCEKRWLEVTIKREEKGIVSRKLHDTVHEGDLLDVEAAFGNFTFPKTETRDLVLIGAGVGITPLMSVLRCLLSCGFDRKIHLLYSCHSTEEFVFRDELEFLQKRHANLTVLATMRRTPGTVWMGPQGHLTKELILQTVSNIKDCRIHLCGPPPMMAAMQKAFEELGVPKENVKREAFGPALSPPANGAPPAAPADVAAQSAPPAKPVTPAPAQVTGTPIVFRPSGKTADAAPGETVLDVAERVNVEIPFSCRVGTCGTCKVRLLSGKVGMAVKDGLTAEEEKSGFILACQAVPQGKVEVEA